MKKIILIALSAILIFGQNAFASELEEYSQLINTIGKNILTANHLPHAEFVITNSPDTFDDYFINASYYKKIEMFSWELSFAKDKGELAAVVAH